MVVTRTSSSCGCTVASVEPKVIAPGAEGAIVVQATPPSAGEKEVSVQVETNSKPTGELVLPLTLVGNAPVPFVADTSGPFQFGIIDSDQATATMILTTHEKATDPPWLTRAYTDVPGLRITGGYVENGPRLGPIVLRRYRYAAEFAERPADVVRGEVVLSGERSRPEYRIPVYGTVRPSVEVTPEILMATLAPGDPTPDFSLLFRGAKSTSPLTVEPEATTQGPFEIRRKSNRDGLWIFELIPRDGARTAVEGSLLFRTNRADRPVIKVPFRIRVLNSRAAG